MRPNKDSKQELVPRDDVAALYFNSLMIDELDSDPSMQAIGPLGQLAWMWAFNRLPVVEVRYVEDELAV